MRHGRYYKLNQLDRLEHDLRGFNRSFQERIERLRRENLRTQACVSKLKDRNQKLDLAAVTQTRLKSSSSFPYTVTGDAKLTVPGASRQSLADVQHAEANLFFQPSRSPATSQSKAMLSPPTPAHPSNLAVSHQASDSETAPTSETLVWSSGGESDSDNLEDEDDASDEDEWAGYGPSPQWVDYVQIEGSDESQTSGSDPNGYETASDEPFEIVDNDPFVAISSLGPGSKNATWREEVGGDKEHASINCSVKKGAALQNLHQHCGKVYRAHNATDHVYQQSKKRKTGIYYERG